MRRMQEFFFASQARHDGNGRNAINIRIRSNTAALLPIAGGMQYDISSNVLFLPQATQQLAQYRKCTNIMMGTQVAR